MTDTPKQDQVSIDDRIALGAIPVDEALPIAKQAIQGKDVFLVDGNALAACFDGHGGVDEAFVKELAKVQPLRVVFRDAGFKDSSVKINVEQIFKLLSPATEVKCI